MKKLILTVAFVAVSQFGFSQVDEAFKSEVLKVLAVNGSGGQIEAGKKQVLAMIPEDKKASFLIEFDAIIAKISDTTAKVYMEEFTKEDIKAMLSFYESPVGKKMNEKSGIISEKSQAAMQEVTSDVQALMGKYMQ